MKEKLEILTFKHRITLFTFILFLIIGVLTPLSGSDWSHYVIGKKGIIECFNNISIADGRIISGFLVNFLSYNKILFDILLAFSISYFVKTCNDLIGSVSNKYMYLYPLIGVLLVSTFMFAFNYVSVSGMICYTFPSILFFAYFINLIKSDELSINTLLKLIFFSIFIMMSSTHLAITFFVANLIYLIFNLNKSNRSKYFTLLLIQFILIIISIHYLDSIIIYTEANQVFNNIPYVIDSIFSSNIIIIILGAIPINYLLSEKLEGNLYRRVVITLFDMILLFSLCYNFFNYSPVNLNIIISKYNGIFATENWYYIIYFVAYVGLFYAASNHYIKNKKLKKIVNILNISSVVLGILLLVSPIFDKGNIVFIVFNIILVACLMAKELDIKVYSKLVLSVFGLLLVYYLSMFTIVKYVDVTRSNYIKEQIESKESNIEVKASPIYLVWRYNPTDIFLLKDFKAYYEIPSKDTIEVKYFGIFEKIEKKVKR